jgi:cytochrome c oxidase subunit 4
MSEHSITEDSTSNHSEHVLPTSLYWAIWAILISLTFFTAWIATVDLGWLNPVVALVIASFKALVVVLYFMHVKYTSEKLTKTVGLATLFWLALLLFLTLTDYATRGFPS